ncbi:MAG: hypothetical protein WCA46_05220 [Actinocatenispora sp.]
MAKESGGSTAQAETPKRAPKSEQTASAPATTPAPAAKQSQQAEMLQREIGREYRQWRFSTGVYGATYYVSRFILIAGAATVAAEQGLSEPALSRPAGWVPLLALVVAIVAAIDTWLKPRERWRGFMQSRDEINDLRIRAAGDKPSLDGIREELRRLRERHRDHNIA